MLRALGAQPSAADEVLKHPARDLPPTALAGLTMTGNLSITQFDSAESRLWLNPKEGLPVPTVFKSNDIQTLADRLYGRGTSVLADDSPSLAADLRTASRILRAMLGKIDAVAAKANETAELLANLRLEVED